MNKTNLIVIFFIFLISYNKSNNDINNDFEKKLNETLAKINVTEYDGIFFFIEKYWSTLPYEKKNLTYQNIEIIKKNCNAFKMPTKCKILYDIFGIL